MVGVVTTYQRTYDIYKTGPKEVIVPTYRGRGGGEAHKCFLYNHVDILVLCLKCTSPVCVLYLEAGKESVDKRESTKNRGNKALSSWRQRI